MASIKNSSFSPSNSQMSAQTEAAPLCTPDALQSLPTPPRSSMASQSDSFKMCVPPAGSVSSRFGGPTTPSSQAPALSLNLRKPASFKAAPAQEKSTGVFMNEDHKNAFWNEVQSAVLWEGLGLLGGVAGVAAYTGLAVLGGLATGAKLANDTAGATKALVGGDKKQALEDCVAGKPAPKGQSADYYTHYQLFMKIVGQAAPDQCIAQ